MRSSKGSGSGRRSLIFQAHALSHLGTYSGRMIPLDFLIAISPALLLLLLWAFGK